MGRGWALASLLRSMTRSQMRTFLLALTALAWCSINHCLSRQSRFLLWKSIRLPSRTRSQTKTFLLAHSGLAFARE